MMIMLVVKKARAHASGELEVRNTQEVVRPTCTHKNSNKYAYFMSTHHEQENVGMQLRIRFTTACFEVEYTEKREQKI